MNNNGFWNEAGKVNTIIDSMQTNLRLDRLKSGAEQHCSSGKANKSASSDSVVVRCALIEYRGQISGQMSAHGIRRSKGSIRGRSQEDGRICSG